MTEPPKRDESEKKKRKSSDLSASGVRKSHGKFSARLNSDKREMVQSDRRIQNTETICQMYLKGYTFNEIAKKVDMHWGVVRDVVDESRKIWIERHNRSLSELTAEQLARIDRVESRAWESYELSRKDYFEKQSSSGSNDKGTFSSEKQTKRRQAGSAEFLSIILNCVKQRTELLGLDKRDDDDTMRHNSMLVVVNSPEEARAIQDYQQFQKMVDGEVIAQDAVVESDPK
jgi:hypothetical protein